MFAIVFSTVFAIVFRYSALPSVKGYFYPLSYSKRRKFLSEDSAGGFDLSKVVLETQKVVLKCERWS